MASVNESTARSVGENLSLSSQSPMACSQSSPAPAARAGGTCARNSYGAPLRTAMRRMISSRILPSSDVAPRIAPRKAFHPSAASGLCRSMRSSAMSLPPRRERIRSATGELCAAST
jgi:hypothetical protein